MAEQDLWIDFLEGFSNTLLGLHDEERAIGQDEAEAKIRLAARLADTAIMEMQYRFFIQRPERKPRKRKSAAMVQHAAMRRRR